MLYDVVGVLGRGGTGVVELAELRDGTRVARKRIALHGSARQADVAVRRLRREAEVLAALRHPNIVRLLDVEEHGESVVLVEPWLEGGSLHDRLALRGPLPPDEVDALARALLSALAAAHAAGVVHRDLSPANICFDRDGTPVLVDFGAPPAVPSPPASPATAAFSARRPSSPPSRREGDRQGPPPTSSGSAPACGSP